eukprot:jgi/Mesen1/7180/ME000037S06534
MHKRPSLDIENSPSKKTCYYMGAVATKMCLNSSIDFEMEDLVLENDATTIDSLPDDVLVTIMAALGAKASSALDVVNAGLACKRLNEISQHQEVLASMSLDALSLPAERWTAGSQRHVEKCAAAGNVEAAYFLGMVEFYCSERRHQGLQHLVAAAQAGHAPALHSLAVIHFNGSGSSAADRNLSGGVLFCASAAQQGHVEAMRELGHCLQDGYGIKRNVVDGRRLLLEANLRGFSKRGAAHAPATSPFGLPQACVDLLRDLQEKLAQVADEQHAEGGQGVVRGLSAAAGASACTAGCAHSVAGGRSRDSQSHVLPLAAGRASSHSHAHACSSTSSSSSSFSGASSSVQVLPSPALPVCSKNIEKIVALTISSTVSFSAQDVQEPTLSSAMCRSSSSSSGSSISSSLSRHAHHSYAHGHSHGQHRPSASAGSSRSGGLDLTSFIHSLCDCLGPILSDFGCAVPRQAPHPANAFLLDWFSDRVMPLNLKVCANVRCGRPETRAHEFRCCAVCSGPSYCSRACQALDWKAGHMLLCQQEVAHQQRQQFRAPAPHHHEVVRPTIRVN